MAPAQHCPREIICRTLQRCNAAARRSGPLKGRLRVPGDKSISHRAFIFGLLTVGTPKSRGFWEGDDVLRGRGLPGAGARIDRFGEGRWRVEGAGLGSLLGPVATLDFGNAGTGSRLMMGVVGGHDVTARSDGDASLRKRPMRRILDPLALMGRAFWNRPRVDAARSCFRLARAGAIEYRTPVASAQIKSAVLLAGLNSPVGPW